MRSPNSCFPRLTAVAIFWLAVLTVASSRAAAPRPVASIDARLPQSPAYTPPRRPKYRPPPTKPFADHVQRSPVSPYMSLFRTDNAGGTIDNYSTLVKPAIRQEQTERSVKRIENRLDSVVEVVTRHSSNLTQLNAPDLSRLLEQTREERFNRQRQVLQGHVPTTRARSRFMNPGHRFGQR